MDANIQEIDSIVFGVYSSEEIKKMSVCKLDNPKKNGYGTVYDERMGPSDSCKPCETCGQNIEECPGHFGHIELNEKIIHPLFYKRVVSFLNCFCLNCGRLLLLKEQINLYGLNKYKGESRFTKIQEKLKKIDMCCHENCGCDQPKCKFSTSDNSIYKVYENKEKNKTSIILPTEEIKKIFDNILDEDIELLGFDPQLVHPKNLIMEMLPVLPICDRPFVKADGHLCDDDLTNQYIEIIKINNSLTQDTNSQGICKELSDTKKQKCIASLRFRILTTFNNSQGKAKHTTNGRAIKGIKERLSGKDSQLRNNLLGKRACQIGTNILGMDGKCKKVEDIVVGDVVVGDDGLPRTVVDTVRGTSKMYTVKQTKGDDYGISCEHILTLKYSGHAEIYWSNTQDQAGGWFIKWYDRDTKTLKSKKSSIIIGTKTKEELKLEIKEYIKQNNLPLDKKYTFTEKSTTRQAYFYVCHTLYENGEAKKIDKKFPYVPGLNKEEAYKVLEDFRKTINCDPIIDIHVEDYLKLPLGERRKFTGVKLSVPIQWAHKPVLLDPRILGIWLGDGSASGSVITNPDKEILEYCRKWCAQQGGKFTTGKDNLHHYLTDCEFIEILKTMDLYDNKHIPEEYIVNDEEIRLLVLAGLIDIEGSVESNGQIVVINQCNVNKAILDGAQRIARSLGFNAEIHTEKTIWSDNDEHNTDTVLTLTISGSTIDRIPTLLERKKCYPIKDEINCYEIEVVAGGIGEFCGFEVDQNNRFLMGDCTITHNCNQTGRTVIGPDPTLKLGQIALPPEMADNLSIPIKVAKFNINMLQKLVNDGKVDSLIKPDGKTKINLKRYRRGTRLCHGDIIIRGEQRIKVSTGRELVLNGDKVERNGELLDRILHINRHYKLDIGWTVERKLDNNDYVILNRQPTLHKASMMAMQIVIKPGKTIRMNLACTKGYNADFDGDEMNIHVPQSPESQTELELLFATQWNIISAQSSKPSIAIVQDSLLGAYRMSLGQQKITRDQFYNVIEKLNLREDVEDRIQHVRRVLKEKGKKLQCYTGKGIISMFLPRDLIYDKKNDADPTEPIMKIWKGVIYEGAINKDIVGSSHNSLIHIINKEYGSNEASYFIDCIQFATNEWNMINIFTVGLGDCLVADTNKQQEIQDVIKKCYIEAEGIKSTTTHPGIKEMRVNATLSKAKDIGLRIAKDSLNKNNNFLSTVNSGSKGDFFNIAQITGLLGQQNLRGQRVPLFLNNGRRTLPHYPFGELSPEMEYESRGFISSSFIKGLSPREFYFHAMSGREGISDTAMGTATSGYMQRRIIKLTEDIKINYDGTVRDSTSNIFQISYGEMGLDPIATTKVKNDQQICDISRLINRLNLKHENVLKQKKL